LEEFFKNFIVLPTLLIVHSGTNTNRQNNYEEGLTLSGESIIIRLRLPLHRRRASADFCELNVYRGQQSVAHLQDNVITVTSILRFSCPSASIGFFGSFVVVSPIPVGAQFKA
jgi:hypothetical protein